MKKLLTPIFCICLFCSSIKAQYGIGINFNKNLFSYPKKSKEYLLGNTGTGISFFKLDTSKRFLNYELSLGFDLNNISLIDQYNRPPVFDYRKKYIHSINILNVHSSLSLKKNVYKSSKYRCYLGIGASPKWFVLSKAKVTYNDSVYYRGDGIRLIRSEFFRIYDLFYAGTEISKKWDFRIRMEGILLQKFGNIDFYYLQTEGNVGFSQLSLQLMLRI